MNTEGIMDNLHRGRRTDIVPENFETIESISKLVDAKSQGR
jgi:hypothetical protein